MEKHDILSGINHESGLTVPPGYFDEFNTRMASSLPLQPWESEQPKLMPRTKWQKLRPYVYMAAMFAGIWCMMKMFDMMRGEPAINGFSGNPELMSAINNDEFYVDYCSESLNEDYLYDQLYEDGVDPSDFI